MEKFKNYIKNHPISAVILVSLIFITGILVVTAISLNPTSEVEVLVAPSSATITINGKVYKNGTYKLPRGNVSVKIEKDGFTPKNYTFNTSTNNKLYDYLTQDGSLSWYETHSDDAIILTTIGDYEADMLSSSFTEKNPISKELPLIVAEYNSNDEYVEFRIDGGKLEDCDRDFCLKITDSTGDNLEYAREKIRELGYNPNDFEIVYEYDPVIPLE